MNLLLVIVGIVVAGLLGLLLWSTMRKPGGHQRTNHEIVSISLTCKHLLNLSQIRQALEHADFEYLTEKSDPKVASKVRKERRRIALKYLGGLREDFEQLMGAAQVLASLSPEVKAQEEWKRFRLSVEFAIKYHLVRVKFAMRAPTFPGLENLAQLVSSLAMDLERAVTEVGIATTGLNPSTSAKN